MQIANGIYPTPFIFPSAQLTARPIATDWPLDSLARSREANATDAFRAKKKIDFEYFWSVYI